ncbi:hypothetical protein ASwh1_270 [Aeromonas phage Aswh_1]|nr:hypothetical protein ASwh1_270 [Aeromonas phage Aswh_1]
MSPFATGYSLYRIWSAWGDSNTRLSGPKPDDLDLTSLHADLIRLPKPFYTSHGKVGVYAATRGEKLTRNLEPYALFLLEPESGLEPGTSTWKDDMLPLTPYRLEIIWWRISGSNR